MQEFEILQTEPFEEVFIKLDFREKNWVQKMSEQLKANPFAGKPLGQIWFREKKFENKRLYFLVSQQKRRVLFLAFGDKKEQQKIINHIRSNLQTYWSKINSP